MSNKHFYLFDVENIAPDVSPVDFIDCIKKGHHVIIAYTKKHTFSKQSAKLLKQAKTYTQQCLPNINTCCLPAPASNAADAYLLDLLKKSLPPDIQSLQKCVVHLVSCDKGLLKKLQDMLGDVGVRPPQVYKKRKTKVVKK